MDAKIYITKIALLLVLGGMCTKTHAIYNTTIKSSDSNITATSAFKKVMSEGGSITFEAGTWSINLTKAEATLSKDVTITGANVNEGVFKRGAFDGASNKTKLIFTGERFTISSTCNTVKLENLEWNRRGFDCGDDHYPNVDFTNVIFDLADAPDSYVDRMVLKFLNGFSGSMKNCSFTHFGSAAMAVNRKLTENQAPVTTRGKLIIDQCLFEPELAYKISGSAALPHDAGNDEYPIEWDHGGSEYINNLFIDCRISTSKGKNYKIINNVFEITHAKDAIHLEEFTSNVLIKGNTFKIISGGKELITLGAQQSSYNIDIIDNTVEQNGWTGKFITGAGNYNILIEGNTIQNATPGHTYINFWSCNNINIQIKPGQPGLDAGNVSVDEIICTEDIEEGTFLVKWSNDLYLKSTGTAVEFVALSVAPNSDEFHWEVKKHFYMGRFNYFSFKNVSTGKYLQVAKGPMGRDQIPANYNKPFVYFGKPVIATTLLDFDENGRVPGFGIFKKNGKYTFMPGGNEKRSQIIKDGDDVVLYVVESEETSTYEWSLIPMNRDTGFSNEILNNRKLVIYLNKSSNTLEINNGNNRKWKIYDTGGVVYLNGKSSIIDVNQLNSGIYIIRLDNGDAGKFVIQ